MRRGANDVWKLGLSEVQIEQFEQFAALIIEWNATRMNLTRLTSTREIAVKHFLDSLALLTVVVLPENSRIIDVGTGPGLPGLALKIVRPDLQVTLLDSTAKKLLFCRAAADALGFADVKTAHARAEDVAKMPALFGQFDSVVARAVAPLDRLLPWLTPFVRQGGVVIALKGTNVADELAAARPVARRLGLTLATPISVTLPETEEPTVRQIVMARKEARF